MSTTITSDSRDPKAKRPCVLIVAPTPVATFIRQDFEILQSQFDAVLFPYENPTSIPRLRHEVRDADAMVIWFAGRHSPPSVWLARTRGIPILTVIGGYEAFWIPGIRYGIPPGSLRARLLRWVLANSRRVAVVSRVMEERVFRLYPEIIPKTTRISNAVSTQRFQVGTAPRRQGVLCVGVINRSTLIVKGWQLFREAAMRMPKEQFTAIGSVADRAGLEFVSKLPPNLTWLGAQYGDDLIRRYQAASVYFQGSVHESFSLALAESMACGCIPVVSRNGALPEVAGDAGYYLDDLTPESASKAITAALSASEDRRTFARQRIVENFDLERRRVALCDLVRQMVGTR
ncbi:MAG: glycosyltransferase family 4 protein [candidate division Zixibacteria bacterium]|nr:glycosyltransferase family 4 protein [candidate division Zixibacteria bacterium]